MSINYLSRTAFLVYALSDLGQPLYERTQEILKLLNLLTIILRVCASSKGSLRIGFKLLNQ